MILFLGISHHASSWQGISEESAGSKDQILQGRNGYLQLFRLQRQREGSGLIPSSWVDATRTLACTNSQHKDPALAAKRYVTDAHKQ